mmetsp:Transcript_15616/g.20008  ORF Transcript_15616/g.20008 Transcript_15616/m.20008 type:complete len:290 (+) Transcript_15616:27-896(+)
MGSQNDNLKDEPPSECPMHKQGNEMSKGSSNNVHPNWLPLPKSWEMLKGGCPADKNVGVNPSNNEALHSQVPLDNQTKPLSRRRMVSSIPKGDYTPHHQNERSKQWVYPSEQMYYNAMKRKGWDPKEEDMPAVVAIHNFVNEEGWRRVCKWESMHSNVPRLVRFQGDSTKLSPKARLMGLMGYSLPFDRHDWYVDRNGQEVRYVLDFYNGAPTDNKPVSLHMDVRPAIDSIGALVDRMKVFVNDEFYPVFDLFPKKNKDSNSSAQAGSFASQIQHMAKTQSNVGSEKSP